MTIQRNHKKGLKSKHGLEAVVSDSYDSMDCTWPAPLSIGFSRQEYWSGLPLPPPEDLPNPGIEPTSLASPALTGRFLTPVPPGKPGEAPGSWFPISH